MSWSDLLSERREPCLLQLLIFQEVFPAVDGRGGVGVTDQPETLSVLAVWSSMSMNWSNVMSGRAMPGGRSDAGGGGGAISRAATAM